MTYLYKYSLIVAVAVTAIVLWLFWLLSVFVLRTQILVVLMNASVTATPKPQTLNPMAVTKAVL